MLRQDDWLDALKNQIFRELLTHMLGDSQTIEPAVDLITHESAPAQWRGPRLPRENGELRERQ